jgi:TldD protein
VEPAFSQLPNYAILIGVSFHISRSRLAWAAAAALIGACGSGAAAQSPPPLVRILAEELDRNFRVLKEKADPAPYYIAYEVTEREAGIASATLGALKSCDRSRTRSLDITIRIGSPKFDNYHRAAGERVDFTSGVALPLDDVEPAIRQRVWLETDRVYRAAAARFLRIRTSRQASLRDADGSDDFSSELPQTHFEQPPPFEFNATEASARARKWSAAFGDFPALVTSSVTLAAQRETRYFVDTAGARLEHGRGYASVVISANAKAADGMDLYSGETLDAGGPAGLPKDDTVLAAIGRVGSDVTGMLRAPVVDPFVGPAILSGKAAAVLFHEIFGHRIEGHRQKDETEGQTFTAKLGAPVLPDFLSIVFDPTRRSFNGVSLNGFYTYDDEGVKAQPVTVVDKGVLKAFLMSRSPIQGFEHSNGHARRQPGFEPVSRQSNLFVESTRQVSEAGLRQMLIAEIKKQGKPYGLYFREVTGGFTTTSRAGVQAFKVIPIVVYRVYPDGRPDELVRGADIVGTPLASFSKIVAAGDRPEISNGYCGAESGSVPVSAVSPAILMSEIEIEKKAKSDDRPPLLAAPPAGAGK